MPITSNQIGGMISQQNAGFGNVASYAQQIAPFGGAAVLPGYSFPQGGADPFSSGPPTDVQSIGSRGLDVGSQLIGAGAMVGGMALPIMGGLIGGRVGGVVEPFTGGLGAFARSTGWQTGGGWLGFGSDLGANVGRLTPGIAARGIAAGVMGAIPGVAIGSAIGWAGGQVAEGAHHYADFSRMAQSQFRFANAQSSSGYGFSGQERYGLYRMTEDLGRQEMWSSPTEIRNVFGQAARSGWFRGAEDAKEVRVRFKEMTDSLKSIAKELSTTMEEAMPFLGEARRQGFWTAGDVQGYARQVHTAAYATGMTTAQVQQGMGMGAQMARSIGGTGQSGATMMAKAMGLAGSATWSGLISDREMSNAGFGIGVEGTSNLAQFLAGGTARFARSRLGRWVMAAAMNKDGTGLDVDRLNELASGGFNVSNIQSRAFGNVGGDGGINRRAYDFVLNEHEMRDQLMEQGPRAMLGMVRGLTRRHLHDDSSRGRLITRRLVQRFFGGSTRQADLIAGLARDAPRAMEIDAARTEEMLDSQEYTREMTMKRGLGAVMRGVSKAWERNVTGPLKDIGSSFTRRMEESFTRAANRFWGKTAAGYMTPGAGVVAEMANDTLFGRESTFSDMKLDVQRALDTPVRGLSGAQADLVRNKYLAAQGVRTPESVGAMGFSSVKEFDDTAAGLKDDIEKFFKSEEATNLVGSYQKNRKLTMALGAGKGGEALRKYVSVGGKLSVTRMLALTREAGIDQSGYYAAPDAVGGVTRGAFGSLRDVQSSIEDSVSSLERAMEGGFINKEAGGEASRLARLAGGRDNATNIDAEEINDLMSDARGAKALKLLSAGQRKLETGDHSGQKFIDMGRDALQSIIADGKTLGGVRTVAKILKRGYEKGASGEEYAKVRDAAGRLGVGLAEKDITASASVTAGRMSRVMDRLGDTGMGVVKEGGKLGAMAYDLLRNSATYDPQRRNNMLVALARMGAEDPDKARRFAALMGPGADVSQVLSDSGELAVDIKEGAMSDATAGSRAISGRDNIRRASRGVTTALAGFGLTGKGGVLSGRDVHDLVLGADSVGDKKIQEIQRKIEERFVERGESSSEAKGRALDLVKRAESGLAKGEMLDMGVRGAAARGIRTMSTDAMKDFGFGADFAERMAKLSANAGGDPHLQQSIVQTALLQQLVNNTSGQKGLRKSTQTNKKEPTS